MDDSCAAYHHDEASCHASGWCNYAYAGPVMWLCSADPCFQYNDDATGASCHGHEGLVDGVVGGCYWYTTIPGYESGFCATDVCHGTHIHDQATCEATDSGPASSCSWDGVSCFMM